MLNGTKHFTFRACQQTGKAGKLWAYGGKLGDVAVFFVFLSFLPCSNPYFPATSPLSASSRKIGCRWLPRVIT